jgi:hypothetical protein
MRTQLACECRLAKREGRTAAGAVCPTCGGKGQYIVDDGKPDAPFVEAPTAAQLQAALAALEGRVQALEARKP